MNNADRATERWVLAADAKTKLNDYAEGRGKLKDFSAAEKALRDFDAQKGNANV